MSIFLKIVLNFNFSFIYKNMNVKPNYFFFQEFSLKQKLV